MDSKFSTYLSGFHGFGRSFNRSVLAHDQRLHQEFREALNNGSLPCNRIRILTIGDKGVGKSSTLQHLQGQVCDPSVEPQATEGIEITICETSEREPAWKHCRNGLCESADDPGLCAAWCVCSGVDSMGGVLHRQDLSADDGGTPQALLQNHIFKPRARTSGTFKKLSTGEQLQRLQKIILRLLYQTKLATPAIVLFFLFSYMHVLNDFGVLCWLAIFFSVPFFRSDFNSSYRFITSVTLQIICVDVAITVKEHITLGDSNQKGGLPVWIIIALALYFGVCTMSLLFGLLCGLGCRTGIAVAFSLMTHHSLLHMNIKAVVALVIGNLLGVLLMRDGFSRLKRIARRRKIFSLCVFVMIAGLHYYQPLLSHIEHLNLSDVLVGIIMGFAYPYGVLKGREIIAVGKFMLPYLLKKGFGFVVALAVGQLMIGWRLLILSETSTWMSTAFSIVAACGFPVYDWVVAQRIKQLEKNGIPITTFRKYLMDSATQDNPVSLKLHFWDNAGDSVYQTMQQFFRPAEAVYLLVFSLEDAKEDERRQLERLRHWLFTVKAHSKNPNTIVFVIGTHRDSVTEEFIASIAAQIDEQLYADFCTILAINGDKGPLYVLENSKQVDEDGFKLRQSVIKMAKMTPFMNELFPIRHLNILNKIQDMQSELPWIMTTSELLCEIAEEDMTLDELQKILVSLHHTGDVIYREDDNILQKYVILKPQSLMDVMKAIVCIPARASRRLTEADDWQTLEVQGIASLKLIKAVVGSETLLPCVMRLMEAYNLLIPIRTNQSPSHQPLQDQGDDPPFQNVQATLESATSNQDLPSYCILPSHLPEFTGDDEDFWEPSSEDEEYYFDFGYVAPDSIFHRLLAKCWCNRDTNERVFKTRGRFRYQGANFYTIQLLKVSVSQNTIRVIILHDGHNRCSLQVLQFLQDLLEKIRSMDFPNLPYSCGPVCRPCSSTNGLKVLKVCGDDKEFPTANLAVEAFMSQGKYHEVHLTPQLKVKCGRRRSCSSTSSVGSSADNRQCEDPAPINHISVAEQSNRVTVITGGNNSRFDIYRANCLPVEGEIQNA